MTLECQGNSPVIAIMHLIRGIYSIINTKGIYAAHNRLVYLEQELWYIAKSLDPNNNFHAPVFYLPLLCAVFRVIQWNVVRTTSQTPGSPNA